MRNGFASTPSFAPRAFATLLRICVSAAAHSLQKLLCPSPGRPCSTASSSARSSEESTPWQWNRNSSGDSGGAWSGESAGSDDTR